MRRRLLATVAVLALAPVTASAALGLPSPTQLLFDLIGKFTGGQVVAQGVTGWPNALHIDHLELHDAKGAWLLADDVQLDWHPYLLVRKRASIDVLTAARLQVPRLQEAAPSAAPAPAPSGPPSLPLAIEVRQLRLDRVELGAPVIGTSAALSVAGLLDVPTLMEPTARIEAHRLDGGGDYLVSAQVGAERIDGSVSVAEPEHGLIAQVAHLPDIGALKLDATASGPRSALATKATLSAGPLSAGVNGTVDLPGESVDAQVQASAPAMTPAPDVSWQGIDLQAHVHGPWTTPDAQGHLQVMSLSAAGAAVRSLAAEVAGNAGQVTLHAAADGVRVPGPDPDLFAQGPIVLDGAAKLNDPARPVTFKLAHPLIEASGEAKTAGAQEVTADLSLPELGRLAGMGGIALEGSSKAHLHATIADGTQTLDGTGTIDITSGPAPVPALIGQDAKLAFALSANGQDLTIQKFQLDGRTAQVALDGGRHDGALLANLRVGLSDLSVLAPTVSGSLHATGHLEGPADNLAVTGHVEGDVGAPGIPRGPVVLDAKLVGVPSAPSGTLRATGRLAGAPLQLAADANRAADGTLEGTIHQADWRSVHAEGAVRLPPGAKLPLGRVALRVGQLDDFRPFIGQALAGALNATLELEQSEARLQAEATGAGIPGSRVGRATLAARVRDPLGTPVVSVTANASGIEAAGVTGSAKLDVAGPQTALAIKTDADLTLSGTPAQIAAAATLDVPGKTVRLQSLQAAAKGETARLLGPATVRFGGAVAVDRLRIGLRQAVLDVSGEVSPRLDANVTVRAPADLAAIADPSLALDGTLALDARLTGTPAAPGGTVRLAANGIRMRTGPGRAVPPANLTATANLQGKAARVDARLQAGSARLAVAGTAPLGAGPVDLRANGGLDLTLLDPILTAAGRRVRGRLTLDAAIGGTASAPRVSGTAQLAGGEVQDFSQGVRIHDITAVVRGEGATVRLVSFRGEAGDGTISAAGNVGLEAPGMPLDLTVTARNARPLSSDNLQINIDADLTVRGQAQAAMNVGGKVLIRHAEIRIPSRLPARVAALQVIRPGQAKTAAPKPAGPAPSINLDLVLDAPQQVFVRGRGVDAEMSGELRVKGSASKPQVSGGFDMRRGQLSLAGTTLDFSRGKVGFDGTGPGGNIDPTLDFVAEAATSSVTATLTIGGYASQPKITLSSVPSLPQDEVLSYLLFRRSIKEIGPFQIASIAASLAELTGIGGGGADPLGALRSGLGLDRLSVGGSSTGSGASVEAGRYVANGVYLGAKQGTSSDSGTGATLQIDITKGLKLETDVGSGRGGNQVGVTYQFEY